MKVPEWIEEAIERLTAIGEQNWTEDDREEWEYVQECKKDCLEG